jgi:hypothetical protein
LISEGASIDELGLSALTDGAYFLSISPGPVAELSRAFAALPIDALGERCAGSGWTPADVAAWLGQWRDALAFAAERQLGLIGHCG